MRPFPGHILLVAASNYGTHIWDQTQRWRVFWSLRQQLFPKFLYTGSLTSYHQHSLESTLGLRGVESNGRTKWEQLSNRMLLAGMSPKHILLKRKIPEHSLSLSLTHMGITRRLFVLTEVWINDNFSGYQTEKPMDRWRNLSTNFVSRVIPLSRGRS